VLPATSLSALGLSRASRSNDSRPKGSAEASEPFGLRHVDELMSSRSGSKTIAKIILIRIRYSICESKH